MIVLTKTASLHSIVGVKYRILYIASLIIPLSIILIYYLHLHSETTISVEAGESTLLVVTAILKTKDFHSLKVGFPPHRIIMQE